MKEGLPSGKPSFISCQFLVKLPNSFKKFKDIG